MRDVDLEKTFISTVWTIVSLTFSPRYLGRPDELLHSAFGLMQYSKSGRPRHMGVIVLAILETGLK